MATKIRMTRSGSKKRPYYKIVVVDSRNKRDGQFIEKVGSYSPLLVDSNEQRVQLNAERIKYWMGVGAELSDRVQYFCWKAGIVKDGPLKKTNNIGLSKKEAKKQAEEAAAKAAEEAKARAEAKKAAAAEAAA